jgi:hypothetical protein
LWHEASPRILSLQAADQASMGEIIPHLDQFFSSLLINTFCTAVFPATGSYHFS